MNKKTIYSIILALIFAYPAYLAFMYFLFILGIMELETSSISYNIGNNLEIIYNKSKISPSIAIRKSNSLENSLPLIEITSANRVSIIDIKQDSLYIEFGFENDEICTQEKFTFSLNGDYQILDYDPFKKDFYLYIIPDIKRINTFDDNLNIDYFMVSGKLNDIYRNPTVFIEDRINKSRISLDNVNIIYSIKPHNDSMFVDFGYVSRELSVRDTLIIKFYGEFLRYEFNPLCSDSSRFW